MLKKTWNRKFGAQEIITKDNAQARLDNFANWLK